MATWHEIYQAYLNAPREQLVATGRTATETALQELVAKYGQKDAFTFFTGIVGSFVCADNKVNYDEFEVFQEVVGTNLTYDQFYDMMKNFNTEEVFQIADRIIDSLSEKGKTAVLSVGLVLCAINGTITVAEQELIERFAR